MKKLYFIQYIGANSIAIDNRIKLLGRYHQVFQGWVVESHFDAKAIYERLSVDYNDMIFVVFGIDKTNYYGRYSQDLWNVFK